MNDADHDCDNDDKVITATKAMMMDFERLSALTLLQPNAWQGYLDKHLVRQGKETHV